MEQAELLALLQFTISGLSQISDFVKEFNEKWSCMKESPSESISDESEGGEEKSVRPSKKFKHDNCEII